MSQGNRSGSGTRSLDETETSMLVKADGYHVYALNGNRLHIYGVANFGDLSPESMTELEGHPREMLVHSN